MFVFNIGYKLKWQKSKNYKNFWEGLVILYWHPKHNFSVKCKNLMSTPTWLRNQFLFFILFLQLVNIQVPELRGCQSPSLQTLTIPCKCTDHLFSGGKDREHLHLEGGGSKGVSSNFFTHFTCTRKHALSCLYLTKATAVCYFRELAFLVTILMYFLSHKPFGFAYLKFNSLSL